MNVIIAKSAVVGIGIKMKTEKELKEEFNITYSEIGQDYTLYRNGRVLCVYPTSKEAKYRRDEIIKEELKKGKKNGK